jgi:hypothetical protein
VIRQLIVRPLKVSPIPSSIKLITTPMIYQAHVYNYFGDIFNYASLIKFKFEPTDDEDDDEVLIDYSLEDNEEDQEEDFVNDKVMPKAQGEPYG